MRMRSKKRLLAELVTASALTIIAIQKAPTNYQIPIHRVYATISKDSSGVTEWHEWAGDSNLPAYWGIDSNGTLWLKGEKTDKAGNLKVGYTGDTSATINWTSDDHLSDLYLTNDTVPWHANKDTITSVRIENGSLIRATSAKYLFGDLPNCTDIDLSNLDLGDQRINSLCGMFVGDKSLTTITGLDKLLSTKNSNYPFNAKITDMSHMFENCTRLQTIDDLSSWNTSNVVSMVSMFRYCSNLTSIVGPAKWDLSKAIDINGMFDVDKKLVSVGDLSKWDVSNVENMYCLFRYCNSLTSVGDLSNWNVSKLWYPAGIFQDCNSLTSVGDLSNWKTGNFRHMQCMFSNCEKLTNIGDLAKWDVSNATNMDDIFWNCHNLTSIGDLSGWNVGNAKTMSGTFAYCRKLTSLGSLDKWNLSNVTYTNAMFRDCENLSSLGDLSNWNISKVVDMSHMFEDCQNLVSLGKLNNWQTGNVLSIASSFCNCKSLTNIGELSSWNVGKVDNMSNTFYGCTKLSDIGDLSNWDVSNVKDMTATFYACESLTGIGKLDDWNVGKVTTLNSMFNKCSNLLTLGDLSKWNVDNVENAANAFARCPKITTFGNLSNWNTSKMTHTGGMFVDDNSLKTLGDLSKWNLENVTISDWMFGNCYNLTGIKAGSWKLNNDTTVAHMFDNCRKITNGDISGITIGNKNTTLDSTFNYCLELSNIDVSNINTENVTSMFRTFAFMENGGDPFMAPSSNWNFTPKLVSIKGLEKWSTSKVTNMAQMFYYAMNLKDADLNHWDTSNVVSMNGMFEGSGFEKLDLSNWKGNSVTDIGYLCKGMPNLKTVDLSNFNTPNLTGSTQAFWAEDADDRILGDNLSTVLIPQLNVNNAYVDGFFGFRKNIKDVSLGINWRFKTYVSDWDNTSTGNSNILPDDAVYYGKWESEDGKKWYSSAKAFAKAWTSSMAGTWNYTTDWTTEGQNVSKTKADGDTDITHQAGTYLVTVPTRITFTGMSVGKVNQDISYSVNVRGNLATGKYIHLATKTTSGNLSSSGISLGFNQGKTVWGKENVYGTVNPDGSNMGTKSTDSVSLTGEVKSVGKYTGLITYESSMTDSDK